MEDHHNAAGTAFLLVLGAGALAGFITWLMDKVKLPRED